MSEPMIIRARIAVPLKEVRAALTDPAALRVWLAEHAEVDPPGRFEFWGRYTPEGSAPHQTLLHLGERTLRFAWDLDGERTTAEITLEEEGPESTIVTVSQTHFDFQQALAESGARAVLMTYWCLALANLEEYLTGRPLTPKVDFTSPDLRASVLIAASREKVFESLIDSEQVTRWFGYPVEIDPVVGGHVTMGDTWEGAKVLELEPGSKFTIDWGSTGVSTWELEGSGGNTRLTMIQSGFDGSRVPFAAWAGNLSGLAELRRYHELPNWTPIWVDSNLGAA